MKTETVNYHGKILTAEMRLIVRALLLRRDGEGCAKCGKAFGELLDDRCEFHHVAYNELPTLNDLMLWCHSCHVDETVAARGHKRRKGLTKAEIKKAQRQEKNKILSA